MLQRYTQKYIKIIFNFNFFNVELEGSGHWNRNGLQYKFDKLNFDRL